MSTPSTSHETDLNSAIESCFESFNAEQVPNAAFPHPVQADDAHRRGATDAGLTVAVLDIGFADVDELSANSKGERRVRLDGMRSTTVPGLDTGTSQDTVPTSLLSS